MRRLIVICLSLCFFTGLVACGGPKDVIVNDKLDKKPEKDSIQRPGAPPKEGATGQEKKPPKAE